MNLDEEIRDGYPVSSYTKRIWNTELDILKKFIEVCDSNNLRYFAVYGTLLGAIRHRGFIPWDNDIDVAMPRADFNRLLEIGKSAFEPPLFFQTPETEEGRLFSTYIKICNSNTTAGWQENYDAGINCGIFIDIFCMDTIPDSPLKRKLFYRRFQEITKMRRFCYGEPSRPGLINRVKYSLQRLVYKYIFHKPDAIQLFKIYNKFVGKYNQAKAHHVANLSFIEPRSIWDKADFDTTSYADFEDIKVAIPAGYDNLLRRLYGDYMKIPDDKSTHEYIEFNPDIPYREYFRQ